MMRTWVHIHTTACFLTSCSQPSSGPIPSILLAPEIGLEMTIQQDYVYFS